MCVHGPQCIKTCEQTASRAALLLHVSEWPPLGFWAVGVAHFLTAATLSCLPGVTLRLYHLRTKKNLLLIEKKQIGDSYSTWLSGICFLQHCVQTLRSKSLFEGGALSICKLFFLLGVSWAVWTSVTVNKKGLPEIMVERIKLYLFGRIVTFIFTRLVLN